MTVTAEILSEQYAGNGSTTVFAYRFKIFDSDELIVRLINNSTGAITLQTPVTQYTVTGVGDDDGGNVTMLTAPAAGFTLDLRPVYEILQPTRLANQGRFLPEIHETALDRSALFSQYLKRLVRRSLRLPDVNDGASGELSPIGNWLNKYVYINANGAPEPATAIQQTTLSQSLIGQLYRPLSQNENTYGVTVVNYFYDWGDLRRYGGVDDGVTLNDTAFSRAIASRHNIYVPETANSWLVSASITPNAGQKIIGEGYLSYVRCNTADVNVISISSKSGCGVESIRLRAFGASGGDDFGNGILISASTDCDINRVWVENARNSVRIKSISKRVNVTTSILRNSVGQYGVLTTGCTDVHIGNCLIEGTSAMAEGVQFNIDGATRNTRCSVTNCIIDLSNAAVVGPVGISSRYVDGITIDGNVIHADTAINNGIAGVFSIIINHTTGFAVTGNYCTGGVAPNPSTIAVGINIGDVSNDGTCSGNIIVGCTVGIYFNTNKGTCANNHIVGTLDGPGILASLGVIADCDVTISGNVVATTTGATADGIVVSKMRGVNLSGNSVRNCDRFGIFIEDCENTAVNGCSAFGCDRDGMQVNNSPRTNIQGGFYLDNNTDAVAGGAGIQIVGNSSDDCIVNGAHCGNVGGTGSQFFGVNVSSAGIANTMIVNCNLRLNTTTGVSHSGTDATIRNNKGYVTESKGTATINSGSTNVTITHGLSVTPTIADIRITFGEQGTNNYGRWWVDNIGATTFQFNVSLDPGASNLDIGWQAQVL